MHPVPLPGAPEDEERGDSARLPWEPTGASQFRVIRAEGRTPDAAVTSAQRPFRDLPSYEAVRDAIERRKAVGYEAAEYYQRRLWATLCVADELDRTGELNAPHDLADVWDLSHRLSDWLDTERADADRLTLGRASAILDELGWAAGAGAEGATYSKEAFRAEARLLYPDLDGDPGEAVWKAVQRMGAKRLWPGESMPSRYSGVRGFGRLVYDLGAARTSAEPPAE
jgi:hypothetical protein